MGFGKEASITRRGGTNGRAICRLSRFLLPRRHHRLPARRGIRVKTYIFLLACGATRHGPGSPANGCNLFRRRVAAILDARIGLACARSQCTRSNMPPTSERRAVTFLLATARVVSTRTGARKWKPGSWSARRYLTPRAERVGRQVAREIRGLRWETLFLSAEGWLVFNVWTRSFCRCCGCWVVRLGF